MSSPSPNSVASSPTTLSRFFAREMLNKVPEVTAYFWVIKVLCTTVGETASDYLSDNVGLGLTKTTYITAALLAVALVFQFRLRRYVAGVYWTGIVLISVVGTQITDNLTDNHGVSLVTSTTVFSVLLAVTFAVWFASERTLSIHTIYTTRREGFYWLAVLFTFALGTAAGDLTAERLNVGYAWTLVIFVVPIAPVAGPHYRFELNAVLSFWLAYILTRPLGASTGDLLSQPRADGGLGLGTTLTSVVFLSAILVVVVFLSITKRDVSHLASLPADGHARVLVVANQTATTPALLDAIRARAARGAQFHCSCRAPPRTPSSPTASGSTPTRKRSHAGARLAADRRGLGRPIRKGRSRSGTTRWTRSKDLPREPSSTRSSSGPAPRSRAGSTSTSPAVSAISGSRSPPSSPGNARRIIPYPTPPISRAPADRARNPLVGTLTLGPGAL